METRQDVKVSLAGWAIGVGLVVAAVGGIVLRNAFVDRDACESRNVLLGLVDECTVSPWPYVLIGVGVLLFIGGLAANRLFRAV